MNHESISYLLSVIRFFGPRFLYLSYIQLALAFLLIVWHLVFDTSTRVVVDLFMHSVRS